MTFSRTGNKENGTASSIPPSVRLVVACIIVVLGLLSVAGRLFHVSPAELTRNDFTQDYISAKAWMDGANPYDKIVVLTREYLGPDATPGIGAGRYNPHLPISILLATPLADLSYRLARALWLLLTSAAIVTGIGLVARRVGASTTGAVVIGVGALALPIAQRHIQLVQSEGIVLLLLAATWVQLDRREGWAGVSLGLATAFRVFPVLMIIPLLRMRKIRTVVSAVIVAAATSLVTSLIVGISNVHHLVSTASPDNFRVWGPSPQNLSLVGIPFQWLTSSLWHPQQVNLPWLASTIGVAIIIIAVLAIGRTHGTMSGDIYWSAIPVLLLGLPLTPEYLLILMIPVLIVEIEHLHSVGRPLGVPLMVAIAVILVGIPPGIQFASPEGTSLVQALPYLVPAAALIFIAYQDWRTERVVDHI